MRQQNGDRLWDVALNAQTKPAAPTQVADADFHLNDGVPVGMREARSEHQKSIASLHRVVAGSETDQARHADVVEVVVLDNSLPRKA